MVILLFLLGVGRADLLFSRKYAMTTSTAFYRGKGEDDHLEDGGIGHRHLHNSPQEIRKVAMVILLSFLGLEGQSSSSLEDDGMATSTAFY